MSLSRLAGARGDTPIWTASGAPAILLNFGLVLTGALMTFFAYHLRSTNLFPKWSGTSGKTMFIVAGTLLLLIGVIPLPLGIFHDMVSYPFFLTAAFSLMLMGVSSLGIAEERTKGKVLIVLGVLMLAPFGLAWAFKGLAIPELMGLAPLVVFCQLIGYKLVKGQVA